MAPASEDPGSNYDNVRLQHVRHRSGVYPRRKRQWRPANRQSCYRKSPSLGSDLHIRREYFNASVLDIDLIGVPNWRQYITIVNLTPYKFVYQNDTSHTYQMDKWDFGDIPPGWSRQCVMDYYDGKQDYDPGEREFEDSQVGVPVSFVITGSEYYGYFTSLSFVTSGPDAWMSNLQATIGDRQIEHVIMPGSHDFGMDRFSTSWLFPNTQTQGLSIYGQLKVGVRHFDLRVVRLNDGTFAAAHVNDERASTIAGGAGFTSEAPGEVIIIWLRYLVDILEYDVEDRYWNETTMQEFYTIPLDELTFGTYLDSSDGAGCVIFINGETTDPDIQEVTTEDLDRGIYGTGRLPRTDNWSEKSDPKEVTDDQVSYYPNLRATIGGEDDTFYISQWVSTLSALPGYGIELTSIFMVNPVLYWYGMMEMSPSGFPTVMLMDYAGVRLQGEYDEYWGAELKALAIGLNLYLDSENCDN
ncbi:PLC-like phosphodiesterase [Aspergillus foveolatus]|uniref:PLC-like phosphodiesterase n=1 Tax=Aspergillus foveolatus TaxID=210207 RepID=UPI003CCD94CA